MLLRTQDEGWVAESCDFRAGLRLAKIRSPVVWILPSKEGKSNTDDGTYSEDKEYGPEVRKSGKDCDFGGTGLTIRLPFITILLPEILVP